MLDSTLLTLTALAVIVTIAIVPIVWYASRRAKRLGNPAEIELQALSRDYEGVA